MCSCPNPQRLAIELSRNHATAALTGGSMADMSHVSLLEQSIDNGDDGDHPATKQLSRDNQRQTVTARVAAVRTRCTVHTAVDVEMASG